MSVVTITINNKPFQIACSDGEEARVKNAAHILSEKLSVLKQVNSTASHDLLLIMIALGLQDEVHVLKSRLDKSGESTDGEQISETLSTMAKYLETIAQKIGK